METWKTTCPSCGSPVYYYPAKLLLESRNTDSYFPATENNKQKLVSCSCTGDIGGEKHVRDYVFPQDFKQI